LLMAEADTGCRTSCAPYLLSLALT
jgi:hypothetical protein